MPAKKKATSKKRTSRAARKPEPAIRSGDWSVEAKPLFRRNPEAPVFYAPLVDVRATRQDLHLLLYVNPSSDLEEMVEVDGQPHLPVESQAEVIVPIDTVEPLLLALAAKYRELIVSHLEEEAAEAGMEVGEIQLDGIDDLLGIGKE